MCRWLAYRDLPSGWMTSCTNRDNSLMTEPAPPRGRDHQRGRLRRRLVRVGEAAPACSAARSRPGTTATCASSRPRSPPLVFAHIRASTGTAVQQTNCHPFRHGRWLWMHNGVSASFPRCKRDLRWRSTRPLPAIEGSTDSELFFYLALTFGLEETRPGRRARGRPRRDDGPAPRRRTPDPDDGRHDRRRAASGRSATPARARSRSLFHSTDMRNPARAVPGQPACSTISPTRPGWWSPSRWAICAGAWNEVRSRRGCRPGRGRRAAPVHPAATLTTTKDVTMATTDDAPRLSEKQLRQLMPLAEEADSVELKLTVPDVEQRSTIAALELDPLDAQIRQVFFFDTPTSRSTRRAWSCGRGACRASGDDSVVKLRPGGPGRAARRAPRVAELRRRGRRHARRLRVLGVVEGAARYRRRRARSSPASGRSGSCSPRSSGRSSPSTRPTASSSTTWRCSARSSCSS